MPNSDLVEQLRRAGDEALAHAIILVASSDNGRVADIAKGLDECLTASAFYSLAGACGNIHGGDGGHA
jgi:hypothetical protein